MFLNNPAYNIPEPESVTGFFSPSEKNSQMPETASSGNFSSSLSYCIQDHLADLMCKSGFAATDSELQAGRAVEVARVDTGLQFCLACFCYPRTDIGAKRDSVLQLFRLTRTGFCNHRCPPFQILRFQVCRHPAESSQPSDIKFKDVQGRAACAPYASG
jgi:hypothetical protein